jgi:hypothetical protein
MSQHELECALYCATEVLNTRRIRNQPIPDWLEANWAEISGSGPKTSVTDSASQTIGVEEVAALLNRTPRHVRRIARSVGGRRINGTWIFDCATHSHTKGARQNNLGFRCRGGYGCDNDRHGGSRGLGGVEVHGAAPAPG